jgi:hypothetical protein
MCIWSWLFSVYSFIFWFCLPYKRKYEVFVFLNLPSLNMMSSNSIHLPANNIQFPVVSIYLHLPPIFLIQSSVSEHLGCFHSLAVVNSATTNISVQVSLLYPDLPSFRYMPFSDINWLYGSSTFSFWRNLSAWCFP